MDRLVACPYRNEEGEVALALEDNSGVMIIYPEQAEGFEHKPEWVLPLLEEVTIENVQSKIPEALRKLAEVCIRNGMPVEKKNYP